MNEQRPAFEALEIETILVPLDGSALAEAALSPAETLARGLGARVILLHVLEAEPPAEVHGEPHLANIPAATAYLDAIAARLGDHGIAVDTHVHTDPERNVPEAIASHGSELESQLIVMASHGSGGIRGFLFGRVAQQVLRLGSRPVLAVQGEDNASPFSAGVVAILLNGEAEAEAAIPIALTVAGALNASLHLIAAVPTVGTLNAARAASATLMPGAARQVLNLERDAMKSYLDGIAAGIAAAGHRVAATLVRGDVATESVDEATRIGAGILAMATHARQGLSGIWSGSIGSRVLMRYQKPLLLTSSPAE
jgi:nucleotide-binding universal stress UspA family protein